MNRGTAALFPAISLISAATLNLEIGLTRIFALSQGYHFAFMVVSISLLGIGAGGTILMVRQRDQSIELPPFLASLAALLSISIILSCSASNLIIFDPVRAVWSRAEFLKILLQYLILSVPFALSGMIISASFRYLTESTHKIYLFDMAGAGAGCILVLLILSVSGGEEVVMTSAVISTAASALFSVPSFISTPPGGRKRIILRPVISGLFLLIVVLLPGKPLEIRMSPYRELSSALNFPGGRVMETIESPSGRLDIVESPAVRAAPGISLLYQEPLPPQIGFTVNGGGLSTVTDGRGNLAFLQYLPSALPYRIKKGADAFVINPGGGLELLSAFENGARGVWGSESSGAVIETMRGTLSELSGGIYERAVIGHGYAPSVIRKFERNYDVIQLPLTDTSGSMSTGIRGLKEEYNLTIESFQEYFRHLNDGGFIAVSLYLLPPPRLELKVLSTLAAAIERSGADSAGDSIIAVRSWGVITILARKGRVTVDEIEIVKGFCRERNFDLVWYPGISENETNIYNIYPPPTYHDFFNTILSREKREVFFRDYIFDVRPANDNRPFFGQTFKMTRVLDTYESVGRKWGILIEGGYLLPWILFQATAASIILILFPLLLKNRFRGISAFFSGVRTAHAPAVTVYFASIGLGYMFLEISLMQRMIPALGEPVYAIAVILFTLLLSTGIGSYTAGRLKIAERRNPHILLILPAAILFYTIFLPAPAERIEEMSAGMKLVSSFMLFFPLGLVMGIPFPTGMSILGKDRPELIPWAWSINGSFSVTGSVMTMILAMNFGFMMVGIAALLCYALAWPALIVMSSETKLRQQ